MIKSTIVDSRTCAVAEPGCR